MEGPGDEGFDVHDISEFHGRFKGDIIYGCGHHRCIAVLAGGYRRGDVHPVHQTATHQVAEKIGVVREDQFGHDHFTVSRSLRVHMLLRLGM